MEKKNHDETKYYFVDYLPDALCWIPPSTIKRQSSAFERCPHLFDQNKWIKWNYIMNQSLIIYLLDQSKLFKWQSVNQYTCITCRREHLCNLLGLDPSRWVILFKQNLIEEVCFLVYGLDKLTNWWQNTLIQGTYIWFHSKTESGKWVLNGSRNICWWIVAFRCSSFGCC